MLLTVESERVVETRVVELSDRTAELDLPVDAGLRGGAFVTATVVRKVDPTDPTWLPHRAVGMARLKTDHAAHDLAVAIEAPAQARPGQTISVRMQTAAPADAQAPGLVHFWAVDEGILLATDYTTPNPADHLFAARCSEVESADIFADLMPDQQRPAGTTRIGGDGGEYEEYRKRMNPVSLPRRAPAVIWRTALPVRPDGSVVAELPLPELTGKLRLMAVAVDGDQYGSAARPVVLTNPVLVELSCPRIAAPDDVFEMPVKIFNCTSAAMTVRLGVSASGPLRLEPPTEPAIRVAPDKPAVVWVRAVATGLGSVSVVARAEATANTGEAVSSRQEGSFAIRPAGPLHSESQILSVQAGEPLRIEPQGKWMAGTARTLVCLGPRPTVQLQPTVEALIDYPYGCVEQTTSRLYVLLRAPDLLPADANHSNRREAIDRMVDAGVARLWSMQTRSGGLSYWPGDAYPCAWGSVYAAEFLTTAERQGHSIDAQFTTELGKYLESELEQSSDAEDSPDINVKAQICYVLARMKRPQESWMTRLGEKVDELDMAGRAYLAGAWLELGRKDRAGTLLSDDVLEQSIAATTGTRPTSQVHQESVLLNILLDLDREHPWIPALVQRLEKSRRNGQWGSTQENAAALAALVRYQLAAEASPASFSGTISQGDTIRPFDHSGTQTFAFDAGRPIEIASSGEGRVHISTTTEGLLLKAPKQDYDRNLVVARQWLDREGKPVDAARLRVGDLVRVEVTLSAPGTEGDSTENVAVVDALPGGMEVENPRLTGSEHDGDTKDQASAYHVEFRDDRVIMFSSASGQQRMFRYALRAISAGSFALPPVQASCMYDSSRASVHGAGRVVIAK